MMTATSSAILSAQSLNCYYGEKLVVNSINLGLREKAVYALIGPSGCGKSTLLRCFNRMNDFINDFRIDGTISYDNKNIYEDSLDPVELRRQVGMVFQKPNPFPSSIYKNITWGPRINGYLGNYDELVEMSLKKVALWDEVKDNLKKSGLSLSGGQQQRLCIARTIALQPKVILMDEPCSALDPISTQKIEALIKELKKEYCILMVTHNMQQAARVSDFTAFMYQGQLIEFGLTKDIFGQAKEKLTRDYVSGHFG